MEPMISRSLPSLVKKTRMTTKGKGKRREPSSLPHIRGARLLPSTGSPSFHSSGFILTERSVRLHACVHTCTRGARVLARASCLRAFVWGMCMRSYTRAGVAYLYAYASVRVRARAWNRYMLSSFLFFSPFRFWRFFPSLFVGLSFFLSKRRRVRERYRAVGSRWTFLRE